MELLRGKEAIDQSQTIIYGSKNTIFNCVRWVEKGIEILIINTFNDDIITTLIPNDIIYINDNKVDDMTLFTIASFFDAHIKSLSDNEVLNLSWTCRLNLLNNPELRHESIKFQD